MITVHHLGVSQSHRIVWLCEELELPYRLELYEREPTRLAPPAYKALHPLGMAPVITDGELVLAESGAIMTYLIERYGEGKLAVSPGNADYASYLFWFHFANGSMMPNLWVRVVLRRSGGSAAHPVVKALLDRTLSAFAFVEARLVEAQFFAGDAFSAADIMMFFPLTRMRSVAAVDLAAYPSVRQYLKRMAARPAFQRALTRADPNWTPLMD
jgi:glutathione S-transferase